MGPTTTSGAVSRAQYFANQHRALTRKFRMKAQITLPLSARFYRARRCAIHKKRNATNDTRMQPGVMKKFAFRKLQPTNRVIITINYLV